MRAFFEGIHQFLGGVSAGERAYRIREGCASCTFSRGTCHVSCYGGKSAPFIYKGCIKRHLQALAKLLGLFSWVGAKILKAYETDMCCVLRKSMIAFHKGFNI